MRSSSRSALLCPLLQLLCALTVTVHVRALKHDRYTGHSVYNVWVTSVEEGLLLAELEEELNLDTWQHAAMRVRPARVMVGPEQREELLQALRRHNITYQLDVPDVARQLQMEEAELTRYRRSRSGRLVPFEDFPSHEEVNDYLEQLAVAYPDLVELVTAGPSYEDREIKYIKISTTQFEDASKPVFFIDAMIHAREWATTPTTLYALHRLLVEARDDERDLLEDIDWIVMPMVNPDGYEYTRSDDRLFRRTRSTNRWQETECRGVDGNRNFDVMFNTTGVSQDPCSQVYPGGEAFSEVETQYVRNVIHEYLPRMRFYMNIHSHGNYVLYAFGDRSLPDNVATVHFVGAAMGAAMDSVKLPAAGYYLVGNSAIMLYGTSGSAQDYAAQVGVPLSYTLELPGLGRGFLLPPQYIEHVNAETWLGLRQAARLTSALYGRAGADTADTAA